MVEKPDGTYAYLLNLGLEYAALGGGDFVGFLVHVGRHRGHKVDEAAVRRVLRLDESQAA